MSKNPTSGRPDTAPSRRGRGNRPHRLVEAASVASVGLEMGLAIGVGLLAGQWLDGYFATEPYLMLVGLMAGIGAAFKALLRAARQTKRLAMESEQAEDTSPGHEGCDTPSSQSYSQASNQSSHPSSGQSSYEASGRHGD